MSFHPNQQSDVSCCCAFVCDDSGKVILDIGKHLPGSSETISALSLIGMVESEGWTEFLEIVRTHVAAQRGIRIHYRAWPVNVLLYGSQTPLGILIFATLTSRAATLQGGESPSSTLPGSMMRRERAGRQAQVFSTSTVTIQHYQDSANQLWNAVHNLTNPISSIISSCEYLVEYSPKNLHSQQLEIIAGIEASARTLFQLSERICELNGPRSRLTRDDGTSREKAKSAGDY